MKAKYLTIAFISCFALAPLAWAQGEEEEGAAVVPKQVVKVQPDEIPGEKMTVQQWKVQSHFFDQHDDSTKERLDPVLVLREHYGVDFPSGATASYSPKNGKLTVKNTPRNLKIIDDAIKDYISTCRPVGRTAEDFKKWAKEEYKRRQTAVKLMEKVNDAKSGQKALDKLMKIYKAKQIEDGFPLGNLIPAYCGSLNVIDRKTRDAVGKKFAKQLEDIYDQQRRLGELEDSGSDEIYAFQCYTGGIYCFADDDKTGERWYITKLGIKVKKAEKSGDQDNGVTADDLP